MTQALDHGSLVLGGNVFGWTADPAASVEILDAFVAAGGRSIDTADVYSAWIEGNSGGDSERILGDWIASRGRRDDVVIATKVSKLAERPGLERSNVRAAIEESLQRLKTDYVDLYYAHADDESQRIEDVVLTFHELVQEGKIRAVGASNFTAERLAAAVAFAQSENLTPFTYAQDRWSLVERGIEQALVPTLLELGVTQLPYSSLASGFLTGKYRAGVEVASARAGGASRYLASPGAAGLLTVLDDVAAAHQVQVASVALAWLAAQPSVSAPIASARTLAQVAPLVASFDLELTTAELDALTQASSLI